MKKILFFGDYINYYAGGAEISAHDYIKSKINIHFDTLSLTNREYNLNYNLNSIFINIRSFRFKFVEYLLYRKLIINYINKIIDNYDELHLYGNYSSYIINNININSNIKITWFHRNQLDVCDFNVSRSQFNIGNFIRRILYYSLAKNNFLAYSKCDIISNSKYMQSYLFYKYNINSKLLYPHTKNLVHNEAIYIYFIGDGSNKGTKIFNYIVKSMPNEKFIRYSNCLNMTVGNLTVMPRINGNDYLKDAKLLLVPSQWAEAYGKVAREAYLAGIPTLVSNVGGLPETVDFNFKFIVNDFTNKKAWLKKVNNIINENSYCS